MTEEPSSTPLGEEQRKARASNRRTIIALGLVIAAFAAPSLFRIGRYLIDLL